MIRSSKHKISGITNNQKIEWLDQLFVDYKHDLEIYINYIIDGVLPLKIRLSSKLLPTEIIKHSHYKREIYAHASQILRSQIKQAEDKRYKTYKRVFAYFKTKNTQVEFTSKKFSELQKKSILTSKYFTKPSLNNITISLGAEFVDFEKGNSFDNFVSIKLPYFDTTVKRKKGLRINVPLKHHRHSNRFKDRGYQQKDTISIKKVNDVYYIGLNWEKASTTPTEPTKQPITQSIKNSTLGIDTGYRRMIVTSNKQFLGSDMPVLYKKIVQAKRNSKNYKKLLKYRDNLVNYYCNQIDLKCINKIVVEDLKNVKHESKYNNKVNDLLSRWVYKSILDKIQRMSEVNGIELVKVSPKYTSQTCSSCGSIHKESRQGDIFKCIGCGYEIDADFNAAINIRNIGCLQSP